MNAPTYVTREQFKAATNTTGSDKDRSIDRLLASAARQVDEDLHRHFYPITRVDEYEWPSPYQSTVLRLYLTDDLLAVTGILSGGTAMTNYVLQPLNSGPPYSRIEVDLSGQGSFRMATVRQRSIVITGRYGYCEDTAVVGTLVDATITNAVTTLTVTDASRVGVGDLIFIGTEAMLVTDRALVANASLLAAVLGGKNNDVVVAVDDGTDFFTGEVIVVDGEEMLITGIATNNLIVKRAYNGSVLAAHLDDAAVYVARTLTVERGAAGTTAAAHTAADPITRNVAPGLIQDWVIAEAVSRYEQEQAGYGRVVGQGDKAITPSGRALADARNQAFAAYYKQRRHMAV
jgi:hypothetical protein